MLKEHLCVIWKSENLKENGTYFVGSKFIKTTILKAELVFFFIL